MRDATAVSMGTYPEARAEVAVELRGVCFAYDGREVLSGVDLRVNRGECIAVMGASGSGKSTLLQIMAGLAVPSAGIVSIAGHDDFAQLSATKRDRIRLRNVGMMFQFGELIPELSLCENVELPLLFRGARRADARASARATLDSVGLGDEVDRFIWQVSGGQQQRAALARALIAEPGLLLADEPTGSLDDDTSAEIMGLLLDCAHSGNQGVVLVTHSRDVARDCDRRVHLEDARLHPAPS